MTGKKREKASPGGGLKDEEGGQSTITKEVTDLEKKKKKKKNGLKWGLSVPMGNLREEREEKKGGETMGRKGGHAGWED